MLKIPDLLLPELEQLMAVPGRVEVAPVVHLANGRQITMPPVEAPTYDLAVTGDLEPDKPERLVKIARSGQSVFRRKLHKEQGGLCPLCNKPIDLRIKGEGAIDHDHDTGRVRGLLHRSCNAAEGKVANAAGRWGAKSMKYEDLIPFLERLVEYLKRPQSRYIYTYHKTEEEEALEKKKRARVTAATRRAKLRMKKEAE